ncbi:unnamed protein product [Musa hybrid cultivar]
MGSEGGGGGGGLFHLFGWNRKSRKKLFPDGNASSEKTIQGNKHDDNMPTSRFHLIDQNQFERVASTKAGSRSAGASSVTNEEGSGLRTPGVIARLMGLDYIPASGISEPYSTPLHDLSSIRDDNSRTVMYGNDDFYHEVTRRVICSGRPELKSQNMPGGPIVEFQTDLMPCRVAKTVAITHQKLLSPVKNPSFISSDSASYIIEAAANVLESELHGGSMGGIQSFKAPLNPSKDHNLNGIIALPRKILMSTESSEGITEPDAPGSLQEWALRRSLKGLKDSTIGQAFPNANEAHRFAAKGMLNGTKSVPGDASFKKNKIANEHSGNAKVGYPKKDTELPDINKDRLPAGYKNITRKKSLVKQSSCSQRNMFYHDISLDRHGKQVQHNVVMDEHLRWHYDNTQNSVDVVSFTFTAPIRKPMLASQASSLEMEMQDKNYGHSENPCDAAECSDRETSSHLKLHEADVDCLGIILERKMWELTSRVQSPYCKLVNGGGVPAYASVLGDSISAFTEPSIAPAEHKMDLLLRSYDDELSGSFESDSLSSDQAETISYKLQEVKMVDCNSSGVDEKCCHQDRSPLSCYSTESWDNAHGSKMGSSSKLSNLVSPFVHNGDGQMLTEIGISCHSNACSQELGYVREILTNTGFTFQDLIPCAIDHSFEILDPILFDKLEETRTSTAHNVGEVKKLKMRRKMLFDSVNECLDSKCSRYFRAGYHSWAQGVVVAMKELAEELYKEISGWNGTGDGIVDELVNESMNTHLGCWTRFEIEAFEAGVEMERRVFNSLVDEVVVDFS